MTERQIEVQNKIAQIETKFWEELYIDPLLKDDL